MVQARYARLRLESGQIFINHSGTGGGVELPFEGYTPTMDIYAHVLPSMQLDAVHRLHDLLKEGASSDEVSLSGEKTVLL